MTKTPEQLAEDYANDRHKDCDYPAEILRHTKKATETVFLAGYQAAKDQLADADKVMPQWISVKERLPEISENDRSNRVLLLRADRFIVIARIEKCVRFVRPLQEALIVETDNGDPIEEFTHWMPLPEAPEDK